MQITKLPVNERATKVNEVVEGLTNRWLRTRDGLRARLGLPGRAAKYDDERYEFLGGPAEEMRRKHYDKSLRLLWKAEKAAPWSTFHDMTDAERAMLDEVERELDGAHKVAHAKISSAEFRALLDRSYTLEQKRAIVGILSAIGHGEAYAWLVSASLLGEVRGTGARAALTMQVLEEAKHFVVMRELIAAFGVEMPRQSAWEYLLLENVLKAEGLDKFFGMNVLVETIALSIFGVLAELPGLDVLRLFHLDESRHTALPTNYFREFPMSERDKRSVRGQIRRITMALPTLPLVMLLEPHFAVLGIDAFDFAGSVMRKTSNLSVKAGFLDAEASAKQADFYNRVFNAYCRATRPGHVDKDFMSADTSQGESVQAVEREIFASHAA